MTWQRERVRDMKGVTSVWDVSTRQYSSKGGHMRVSRSEEQAGISIRQIIYFLSMQVIIVLYLSFE